VVVVFVVEFNRITCLKGEKCVVARYNFFFCILVVILFFLKSKEKDGFLFEIGVGVKFQSSYFV